MIGTLKNDAPIDDTRMFFIRESIQADPTLDGYNAP